MATLRNKTLTQRNPRFAVLPQSVPIFENPHLYYAVLGLSLIVSGILLSLPKGSFMDYDHEVVIWSTAACLGILAAYAYKRAQALGQNPWLYPSSLLMVTFFVRYGLGLLVAYYCDQYPWQAMPELGNSFTDLGIKDNLPNVCHLILLGSLAFYLGAEMPVRRFSSLLPDLRWPVDDSKFRHNLVMVSPVALFISLALSFSLPYEYRFMAQVFGNVLLVFTVISSYWFFIATAFEEKIKWGGFIILICCGQALMGLKVGMTEGFLLPLVMVALGFILARKSLPWKGVLVAVPFLILVALPWISLFKWSVATKSMERFERSGEEFSQTDVQERIERSLERLVLRWALIRPLGAYVQYYPEMLPYDGGRSFMIELTGQIPRFLWPEKPNMALELNRYNKYVGLNPDPEGPNTGVFDAFTEYYINFGMVGLFLLSVLHGTFVKVLFDWLVNRAYFLFGASIFLILYFQNHALFGLLIILPMYIRELLIWNILLFFMSRKLQKK